MCLCVSVCVCVCVCIHICGTCPHSCMCVIRDGVGVIITQPHQNNTSELKSQNFFIESRSKKKRRRRARVSQLSTAPKYSRSMFSVLTLPFLILCYVWREKGLPGTHKINPHCHRMSVFNPSRSETFTSVTMSLAILYSCSIQ